MDLRTHQAALLMDQWSTQGAVLLLAIALIGILVLVCRGRPRTAGWPQYVALGSSFAAGIGLGPRAPGSPRVCMQSINGYPQQLARLLGLSLVDVSCSGAVTKHVLRGGQYFQRPQLDALATNTELVTLTVGGNDVRYVGDLSMLAARRDRSFGGWLLRNFWKGPQAAKDRDFAGLQTEIRKALDEIRRRSPCARIIVATYPTIVPEGGVCPKLRLTESEADLMREVGRRLSEATRAATIEAGAILVDMEKLSVHHHACAAIPWVNGSKQTAGTQFHPTLVGARATAQKIARVLGEVAGGDPVSLD